MAGSQASRTLRTSQGITHVTSLEPAAMTLKQAQAHLRDLQITLRKVEGEYQVKPLASKWGYADTYYTMDLADAVETGEAMAKQRRSHA